MEDIEESNTSTTFENKTQIDSNKWTDTLDKELLHIVKIVYNTNGLNPSQVNGTATTLPTGGIPSKKGGYSKEMDNAVDWDLVASTFRLKFEETSTKPTGQECKQRLLTIFHKIPKQKPLVQLVEEAQSAALLKLCHEKKFPKSTMNIIWRNISKVKLHYMAKKLKKAKNQVPTDDYIQKLSSKFDRMNPIKKLKISCKILKINPQIEVIPAKVNSVAPQSDTSVLDAITEEIVSPQTPPPVIKEEPSHVDKAQKKPKYILLKGEPKPPALNPYAFFTKWVVNQFPKNITGKERLKRVSEEWKHASDELKEKFIQERDLAKNKYLLELHEYYKNITDEDEKQRFELQHKSRLNKNGI